MDQDGGFGGANGPKGGPGGGGAGFGRGGKIFDDLAGVAGGAFSALTGLRNEAEAVFRAQAESMLQRLDLVRREDLDAAMELARRARLRRPGLGVLLVTGFAGEAAEDDLAEARAGGPFAILRKPVTVEQIAAAIAGLLAAQPETAP